MIKRFSFLDDSEFRPPNPPTTPLNAHKGRLKYIVGLDFGTTNSGVSFAPSVETATDKINIIKDWPSNPGVVSKVPSIIAYAEENHDDELEEDAWGFSVNGGMTSYVFTKLLLGQDSRSTETRLKGLFGKGFCTLPDNKSAQDVCTDYLRGIYHHVVKKIEKPNPVLFRVTPLEFWITVPAIWKEHAKTATLHAARDAGFGSRRIDTVHLITEPEAAALSVLVPKVGIDADIELDSGPQNILICDCGGGTVDIVTYHVTMNDGGLQFDELLNGAGAMCGSVLIDNAFNNWMIKKFGHAYESLPSEMRGSSSNFFRQFETAKCNFTGPEHKGRIDIFPIQMDVPESGSYRKNYSQVRLTKDEMMGLFEESITKTISLVESQVEAATAKGEKIDMRIFHRDIELYLTQPSKYFSQSAIVRGAAIRGLMGLRPSKRLARRHYGYSISFPFREGIDDQEYSWIDDWSGDKWCRNRMEWFINKVAVESLGDSIDSYTKKTFPLWKTSYTDSTDLVSIIHVWNCDRDIAPDTSRHWSMSKMGKVSAEFSQADKHRGLSKWSAKRHQTMYRIDYDIEVDLFSDQGDLQFRVILDGVTKVNARIQYEGNNEMGIV
ncbi:hsp70-like protein [Halenospora varia]|nr:hsp70-like protein [Halenospora varia]